MDDFGRYEWLTWASTHLNPDEFAEAQKYGSGQDLPPGEYVDAESGQLVVVRGGRVPKGTVYLSLESLQDHGSFAL